MNKGPCLPESHFCREFIPPETFLLTSQLLFLPLSFFPPFLFFSWQQHVFSVDFFFLRALDAACEGDDEPKARILQALKRGCFNLRCLNIKTKKYKLLIPIIPFLGEKLQKYPRSNSCRLRNLVLSSATPIQVSLREQDFLTAVH